MYKLVFILCAAAVAFGADDPWGKVKDLKIGTELRVYKVGAKQPVLVKFSDVSDDALIVTTKDEETAIPKEEIDRIDYRPLAKTGRVSKQTTATSDVPDTGPVGPRPGPHGAGGPSSSSSSSVSMGGKPDFETIYRRTSVAPAAPQK
jgi:hypothetical protein